MKMNIKKIMSYRQQKDEIYEFLYLKINNP